MSTVTITLVTDRRGDEPCILLGFEYEPLRIIKNDSDEMAVVLAPNGGWTHTRLSLRPEISAEDDGSYYDAFLGDRWIGSTEV
jgi:hypothetical protein